MNKTNLIVGERYGKLVVLANAETRNWVSYCLVRCDCGKELEVQTTNLKTGNTKSCGCSHHDVAHNSIDLVGKRFGRLLVISRTKSKKNRTRWVCQCDCGRTRIATGKYLRQGKTQSCGCIKREQLSLPPSEASRNHLMGLYMAGAERRSLVFKITLEDFIRLTSGNCYYCRMIPSSWHRTTATTGYLYNGIDRRDNSRGYELDNCVSCCTICNRMKMALGEKEFITKCCQIADNFKKSAEMTDSSARG
jgi:hypothetical protein